MRLAIYNYAYLARHFSLNFTYMLCFLIDDDLEDQELFLMALQDVRPEINCVTAEGGHEALLKLQDENFNPRYIFLDMNMPKMSGLQCLSEIKKIRRLDEVPVIIYSTSSDRKDELQTKELGATVFFTKPSRISELAKRLNDIIQP